MKKNSIRWSFGMEECIGLVIAALIWGTAGGACYRHFSKGETPPVKIVYVTVDPPAIEIKPIDVAPIYTPPAITADAKVAKTKSGYGKKGAIVVNDNPFSTKPYCSTCGT